MVRERGMPILLAAAAVLLSAAVSPGAPSVELRVGKHRVVKGEPIDIEVAVKGGTPRGIELSSVKKDFIVESRGEGSRIETRSVGFRVETVREYVYSYSITPKKTGSLTIPTISVVVGGTVCATKPVPITVGDAADEGTGMTFSVRLPKNTCYVGEQLPLTIRLEGNMPVRQLVSLHVPWREDERFFIYYGEDGNLEFSKTEERVGERSKVVYTARAVLIPRHAGTFSMDRPAVTCIVQTGWKMVRSIFGQTRRPKFEQRTSFSPAVRLTVKKPPEAGRPPDFTGIVGRPRVRAEAKPLNVSVGQPIDYAVMISGLPYLGEVRPIELGRRSGFTDDFKVQEDGVAGSVEKDVLTFRRTLRAKNDKVSEIPAFRLSYLDSETGRYDHVSAGAIPIKVNPTKVVGVGDGLGQPVLAGRHELETRVHGIAGNEIGMDVIEDEYFAALAALKSPGWLALTLGSLLAYAALVLKVRSSERRMQDEAGVKKRMARGKARKALRALERDGETSDFNDRLIRTLYEYVGEKLRKNPAGLTPQECGEMLEGAGVSGDVASEVRGLLEDLEEARFGGAAGAVAREEMLERAGRLVKNMEKAL